MFRHRTLFVSQRRQPRTYSIEMHEKILAPKNSVLAGSATVGLH